MKVLNRLTHKHLLMNKKRTIVTIIGIILSTALMVGIGLLMSTFLEAMKIDAISYNGRHHASFSNLTLQQKEELKLNINFSETYSFDTLGFASISGNNVYKPYLYVVSADSNYFKNETLIEGNFPKNDTEIVLSNHLKLNGGVEYKIGDEITLDIGSRVLDGEEIYSNNISFMASYDEKDQFISLESLSKKMTRTYKIVGFVKRSNNEDYSAPGYMAFTTQEKNIVESTLFALYKNVKKTYTLTSDICQNFDNITCNTNDSLLYYYGISRYNNVNEAIISMLSIALSLLSAGCIIVIYNSFAISTMERKKSFGLYSSLGATPKQIKYTVFYEAFLVGSLGIFLGILSAFLGIYVTVSILDYLVGDAWGLTLKFVAEPLYIIIPVVFMIFVVYLSAFIPAHRSSKVSSIQMIRENDEIKIPRKKVKTPKFIRKIFGMEGEIALKNLKRNKRKYRITLLSLFISIVLFISFSTYLVVGIQLTEMSEYPEYDISVVSKDIDVITEARSRSLVDKSYYVKESILAYERLDSSFYDSTYYKSFLSNREDDYLTLVELILEDSLYEDLVRQTKSNMGDAILYNHTQFTIYKNENRKTVQSNIFKKGLSSITLCEANFKEEDMNSCKNISINLVDSIDFLKYIPYDSSSTLLFVSQSMANSNSIYKHNTPYHFLTILSNDYRKLYDELDKKYQNSSDVTVESPKIIMEQEKNSLLAIKILLYGFISLVSLIGITSVFNTIHTSIHLRRKEFAMLRSVGLSPNGFNRMIFFESFFFGLKSLFYALPVSFIFILLINNSIGGVVSFGHIIIPWQAIIITVVGVFFIVLLTMWYSVRKIKKENILHSLRDENI